MYTSKKNTECIKRWVSEKGSAGWLAQVSGPEAGHGTTVQQSPDAAIGHLLSHCPISYVEYFTREYPPTAWKGENDEVYSLAALTSFGSSARISVHRAARSNSEDNSGA